MNLDREEAGSLKTRLPRVFITPEAKIRLDLYVEAADGEISGLGTVTRLGNDFLITAVHLFEQVCTGASTDLSSEDVAKFLVGNKRGDFLARLDLYEPIQLTLDGLKFEVWQEAPKALRAEIKAEVAAKVKTPPPISHRLGFGGLETADRPFRSSRERWWEEEPPEGR